MDFQPFKSFRTQRARERGRDEIGTLNDTSKLEGANQIIENAEEEIESATIRATMIKIVYGARNAILELCNQLEEHDKQRIARLAVNLAMDAKEWWGRFRDQ